MLRRHTHGPLLVEITVVPGDDEPVMTLVTGRGVLVDLSAAHVVSEADHRKTIWRVIHEWATSEIPSGRSLTS